MPLPNRPRVAVPALIAALLAAPMVVGTDPAQAATTGANGLIAFTSPRGPHRTDIWVARRDGSSPVLAARKVLGNHSEPTYSPECGPHLAFVAARPGRPGNIWWATQWGKHAFQVTKTPYDERSPGFSPDGGRIVYSRARWNHGKPGQADIWFVQLKGAEPRSIVGAKANDISPAWSPDGDLIAFSSNRGRRAGYGIYMVDLRSAFYPPFTIRRAAAHGRNPQWNPSGRQIVFDYGGNIWLVKVNPETGAQRHRPRRLTRHPPGQLDSNPQFSPNRKKILFQRGDRVWVMRSDGRREHRFLPRRFRASDPDQRPEGTVFPSTAGNDVMKGTGGPDLFCPSRGSDVMYGFGGNDALVGGRGHDVIYGGAGDDVVGSGGARSVAGDLVYGGDGDDFLLGSPRADVIHGGSGADRLIGMEGGDKLVATDRVRGNDYVVGSRGNDTCLADKRDIVIQC